MKKNETHFVYITFSVSLNGVLSQLKVNEPCRIVTLSFPNLFCLSVLSYGIFAMVRDPQFKVYTGCPNKVIGNLCSRGGQG